MAEDGQDRCMGTLTQGWNRKEHWYSRTGEWKHYAWSHFGAEHKHWAATPWFGKDTKEIGVSAFAEHPLFRLDSNMKGSVVDLPELSDELCSLSRTSSANTQNHQWTLSSHPCSRPLIR